MLWHALILANLPVHCATSLEVDAFGQECAFRAYPWCR